MSALLDRAPYATRDNALFLDEMCALTRRHLAGCPEFARMWPSWRDARSVEELPFVHVGVFKQVTLKTAGAAHERTLRSSGTSGTASAITLDAESSALQARSSVAILSDFIGSERTPLLIVDHSSSLRQRQVSARVAAAMSLRPLATDIVFALERPDDFDSLRWELVCEAAERSPHLRVYGFTTALWYAWGRRIPNEALAALAGKRIDFVHSGGWKKLESESVSRERFDAALLRGLSPESRVVDYYGLVEQIGVVYPLCRAGFRHVPVWGEAIVRDPWTLAPLADLPGMLQLMNVLAYGAPYHSVLTEDQARIVPGVCSCGRAAKRFELLGRVPKAELRGCANV